MALLNNLSTNIPNFLGNTGQQASANGTTPTIGTSSGVGGLSSPTSGSPMGGGAIGPGQFNPGAMMHSMGGGMPQTGGMPQPQMQGMPPMPQQPMPQQPMPTSMSPMNPQSMMQSMTR